MKKLLVMFNQMLSPTFGTGGDVFGNEIVSLATEDKDFECTISVPTCAKKAFEGKKTIEIGHNLADKHILNFDKMFTYFPSYIVRGFEFITSHSKAVINTYDILYSTGDFLCNTLPASFIKARNPQIVFVTNIFHINESPLKRAVPFFQGLVSYLLQRISFILIKKYADTIFVLSELVAKELRQLGFTNTIVVSAAGLDVEKIEKIVNEVNTAERATELVFFNRVNHTKGIFDLPYLLSQVQTHIPDAKLDIIGGGSGATIRELQAAFEAAECLDSVTMHGYVENKDDVYQILNGCKVFAQPSYEEGWSIILHETILCGCYPIVYDLPIYRHIFGKHLAYVPLGDKEKLAKCAIEVLSKSQSERDAEVNMLKQISKKYTWESVYKKQKFAMINGHEK